MDTTESHRVLKRIVLLAVLGVLAGFVASSLAPRGSRLPAD